MEKSKDKQQKIKKPSREELDRTLQNIAEATEEQELRRFGLAPELEKEVESMVSSNPKVVETLNRKDQAIEAARQWVKSHPRYRIKYLDKQITVENVDGVRLDKEFLDFFGESSGGSQRTQGNKVV